MTIKYFCSKCDEPGDITSRKFGGNIVVAVVPQPEIPHRSLCEDCLAELLLSAVVSLEDTPTTRDYLQMKQRAADASKAYLVIERVSAERDETREKLQEARTQTTTEARYDAWLKEKASLHEKIEALEAARDVALTRAAQAEKNAAEVAKRAQAAQAQAKVEDSDISTAWPPARRNVRAEKRIKNDLRRCHALLFLLVGERTSLRQRPAPTRSPRSVRRTPLLPTRGKAKDGRSMNADAPSWLVARGHLGIVEGG